MVRENNDNAVLCRRHIYLTDAEIDALRKYGEYVKMNYKTLLKYIIVMREREFIKPDNVAKVHVLENMSIPFEKKELNDVLIQLPRYIVDTFERYLAPTRFYRHEYYRAIVLDDIKWMQQHAGNYFENELYTCLKEIGCAAN